jgi:hypothetical protein
MKPHFESVLAFLKHIKATDDEIKNVTCQMKVYGQLTVDEYLALEPMFY